MRTSILDRFLTRLAAFMDVESSNLVAVDYDEEFAKLRVKFRSGSVYEYDDVPYAVYQELMDAESHGKYFHKHIRTKYHYRKL